MEHCCGMKKKDPRFPGMSFVSPYVCSPDIEKTLAFYKKAFGFCVDEKSMSKDENGVVMHAEFFHNGESMMIGLEGKHGNPARSPKTSGVKSPIFLYLYVDNVDEFYQKALAAGAESVMAPNDAFWGDRMCSVRDIDGYEWGFATHMGHVH